MTDLVAGVEHLETLIVLTAITLEARVTAAPLAVDVHWDVSATVSQLSVSLSARYSAVTAVS